MWPEDEGDYEQSIYPKTVDAPMDGTYPGIQIVYAEDLLLEQFIAGLMAYDNWNDTETFTHGTTDCKGYCNATINVKTSHLANSTNTSSKVLGNGWFAAPSGSGMIIPEEK